MLIQFSAEPELEQHLRTAAPWERANKEASISSQGLSLAEACRSSVVGSNPKRQRPPHRETPANPHFRDLHKASNYKCKLIKQTILRK